MKRDPDRASAVAPAHVAYWRALELGGYVGGPFADRFGGLIVFEIDSRDRAARIVAGDPLRA
jgi:hypothetical protein